MGIFGKKISPSSEKNIKMKILEFVLFTFLDSELRSGRTSVGTIWSELVVYSTQQLNQAPS